MMNPSSIYLLFQAVAALLIFVIGYVALFLALLAGFGMVLLMYHGARSLWFFALKHSAPGDRFRTTAQASPALLPCAVAIVSPPVAAAPGPGQ